MRILVCGGRDYNRNLHVYSVLDAVHETRGPVAVVISGGARGADYWGERWAALRDVPCVRFPADWETHGRTAGALRNQQMLDEGKPDLVVAFPGGRGTADMVRRAFAAGVEVLEISA